MRYFRSTVTGAIERPPGAHWEEFDRSPYWEEVEVTPKVEPKRYTRYINIYSEMPSDIGHSSRERADAIAEGISERVGCQRVELVEGTWDT